MRNMVTSEVASQIRNRIATYNEEEPFDGVVRTLLLADNNSLLLVLELA